MIIIGICLLPTKVDPTTNSRDIVRSSRKKRTNDVEELEIAINRPSPLFPQRFKKIKKDLNFKKLLEIFKQL